MPVGEFRNGFLATTDDDVPIRSELEHVGFLRDGIDRNLISKDHGFLGGPGSQCIGIGRQCAGLGCYLHVIIPGDLFREYHEYIREPGGCKAPVQGVWLNRCRKIKKGYGPWHC